MDALNKEVEEKVDHVLKGVSETLERYIREGQLSLDNARELLEALEPSFGLLMKKWTLIILYALLLAGPLSFNRLHELTRINRRSLSVRLKELEEKGFVQRVVKTEPPISTVYSLTEIGRDTALLMIPLIYYVARRVLPFES